MLQTPAGSFGGSMWLAKAPPAPSYSKAESLPILSTSPDSGHRRFYSEPDVALIQQDAETYMAISIGSGWRAHPLNDVVDDAQYVIRMSSVRGAPEGYGVQLDNGSWRPMTENDLVQVNAPSTSSTYNDYSNGWFIRLPDAGEKVLSSSLIFKNALYFTTYVPDPDVDACSTGIGGGYAYALSIVDGTAVLDFDGDGTVETTYSGDGSTTSSDDIRYALKHRGIPSSPALLIAEGQDPELFIGTEKIPTSIINSTTRNLLGGYGSGRALI